MRHSFDHKEGLIVVRTRIRGPSGQAFLRIALDTGATSTMINVGVLVALGYDPGMSRNRVQVTTGSGVEFAPRVRLTELSALSQTRIGFPVLAHTLPPSTGVDGLLGLDFMRGLLLSVDFRKGKVYLK